MADSIVYKAMAEGHYPTSPLAYRILIPLIARYSPLPNEIDFLCITTICTTVIIYNVIKIFEPLCKGAEWKKSFVFLWLQTGFCFSSFYDNPETDTAALAAWVLAYRFFKKRPIFTAFVLSIATAARETTLFIVPILAIKSRQLIKPFFISVPALIVFTVIRIFIPAENFLRYYFLNRLFIENFFDPHWLSQVITVFGIAPTVLAMEKPQARCLSWYKIEFWVLLIFVFVSCCIAAAIDRFVFMLFPFVLVPACIPLSRMSELWKIWLLGTHCLLMTAKFYFIKYWRINEWYEVLVYACILLIPIIAKHLQISKQVENPYPQ